jgi:hypothetical protein
MKINVDEEFYKKLTFLILRVKELPKKTKLHLYLVSIVPELLPTGLEKRVRYCLWFQLLVWGHPGILDITWFTDEAWFHLSGYINSQNTRVWAEETPHEIHTEPLHSDVIGLWCVLSRR